MHDGIHIAFEVLSKQKGTLRTQTLFLDKVDFIAKKRSISSTLNELNNSQSKTSEMDEVLASYVNNTNINLWENQVVLSNVYNTQLLK